MYKRLAIIIILVTILSGCKTISNNEDSILVLEREKEALINENNELKETNNLLNKQIINLKTKLNKGENQFKGGLLYISVEEKERSRFVDHETYIKSLPSESAYNINKIMENTLVSILDKVSVQTEEECGREWYYVAIPVYDTPMDYKGWIKVEETVPYTKENQIKLQSDVGIIDGSEIIESYEFPNFDDSAKIQVTKEDRGRIDKKQDGYVRINCAGGRSIWVKEEYIVYPSIPKDS